MTIINVFLFQLLAVEAPCNQVYQSLPTFQENVADSTNRLCLAVSNHLYFDSTKVKIFSVLPGSDMQIDIKSGFLEVRPHKAGSDSFEINTNLGKKRVKYIAFPLPEDKVSANKILGRRQNLILR